MTRFDWAQVIKRSLNFIQKKFKDPISYDNLIKKLLEKYGIKSTNN